MINWPAVIKYHGEDELTYVNSESEWNNSDDFSAYDYEKSDRLIDSHGHVYHLEDKDNGYGFPTWTNNTISLNEFIHLVKLHASAQGECCIEKIVFKSVADGMNIVASLNDN